MTRALNEFDGDLLRNSQGGEALRFLRHPPLPFSQRLGYRILFAAAVATLEPKYRDLLGLRTPRLGPLPLPVRTATRLVLSVVRCGLGRNGPSESAARQRRARLGYPDPARRRTRR